MLLVLSLYDMVHVVVYALLLRDLLTVAVVDIHPLALEDVLHQRGNQSRSKADYYMQHLFIRMLRHTLGEDDVDDPNAQTVLAPSITRQPRSSSPEPMSEEEEDAKRGSWGKGETEDDLTLAGSRFSTKRAYGSMNQMPTHDLERGKRGFEKHQNSLALRMVTTCKQHMAMFVLTCVVAQKAGCGGNDNRRT